MQLFRRAAPGVFLPRISHHASGPKYSAVTGQIASITPIFWR